MSDNINTTRRKGKDFWGPPIWTTIHILAATLRPENAKEFEEFLWLLTRLLPCETCKRHLTEKLQKYPPGPYLTNNHDAFFYSYTLHDMVNEQVNREMESKSGRGGNAKSGGDVNVKLKESPSFDDIKSFYFSGLSQECKECSTSSNIKL